MSYWVYVRHTTPASSLVQLELSLKYNSETINIS